MPAGLIADAKLNGAQNDDPCRCASRLRGMELGHSIRGIQGIHDDKTEYQGMTDIVFQAVAIEIDTVLNPPPQTWWRYGPDGNDTERPRMPLFAPVLQRFSNLKGETRGNRLKPVQRAWGFVLFELAGAAALVVRKQEREKEPPRRNLWLSRSEALEPFNGTKVFHQF
jgi:hypothetical protein